VKERQMRTSIGTRARVCLALVAFALATTSCTGGINAGEDGGVAFIVFAAMLVVFLGILWLILGRED
jgi:hypothetical protein